MGGDRVTGEYALNAVFDALVTALEYDWARAVPVIRSEATVIPGRILFRMANERMDFWF